MNTSVPETKQNIRLTSAEIGALWTTYVNDSLQVQVLHYFINKTEDLEIRPILEQALNLARSQKERITAILLQEKHPIPIGFTEEDVNINAPRLF